MKSTRSPRSSLYASLTQDLNFFISHIAQGLNDHFGAREVRKTLTEHKLTSKDTVESYQSDISTSSPKTSPLRNQAAASAMNTPNGTAKSLPPLYMTCETDGEVLGWEANIKPSDLCTLS
jgi:hypothetical protein